MRQHQSTQAQMTKNIGALCCHAAAKTVLSHWAVSAHQFYSQEWEGTVTCSDVTAMSFFQAKFPVFEGH